MERKLHYATVTEALEQLKQQGFTVDFNLEENCLACELGKFEAHEMEIVDVYRYEGDSDPGDEATVYALQSKSGVKGVLVSGYGASGDATTAKILETIERSK